MGCLACTLARTAAAAPAPAPSANALPGVSPEGTVTLPPIVTGSAVPAPPGVMLPPSPQHAGPNASAPSDGIVETQHFLEVADYVSKLKQRVDKLHLATSALVKHSQHTSATLTQFAATVTELEEAETKAIASFARGAATEAALRGFGRRGFEGSPRSRTLMRLLLLLGHACVSTRCIELGIGGTEPYAVCVVHSISSVSRYRCACAQRAEHAGGSGSGMGSDPVCMYRLRT